LQENPKIEKTSTKGLSYSKRESRIVGAKIILWIIYDSGNLHHLLQLFADYLHFQILLIFNISKVSWFVTFPKSIVCQDLYSLLHYFGYKKILGLIIGNKKQSLEARADAFSRLKSQNTTIDFTPLWSFKVVTLTHSKLEVPTCRGHNRLGISRKGALLSFQMLLAGN
jgi:hypothetical protein